MRITSSWWTCKQYDDVVTTAVLQYRIITAKYLIKLEIGYSCSSLQQSRAFDAETTCTQTYTAYYYNAIAIDFLHVMAIYV